MKNLLHIEIFTMILIVLASISGCAPVQNSPEGVVRAWLNAAIEGECKKAESYSKGAFEYAFCGPDSLYPITQARIDSVVVEKMESDGVDASGNPIDLSEFRMVTLKGKFDLQVGDATITYNSLPFTVINIDGEWYVWNLENYDLRR
jgi:hypothetical protein